MSGPPSRSVLQATPLALPPIRASNQLGHGFVRLMSAIEDGGQWLRSGVLAA